MITYHINKLTVIILYCLQKRFKLAQDHLDYLKINNQRISKYLGNLKYSTRNLAI